MRGRFTKIRFGRVEREGKDINRSFETIRDQKRLMFHFTMMLAFALIFGPAGYASADPPARVEIAGISTPATEQVLPWGVERIGAELAHSQNKGQGIKVAILDTGIDLDHPDLRVAGDVTFVPGTTSGDDDNGHGTLVAGIIAALDNDIGTVGIAPEVELYAVKVLDRRGTGTMRTIRRGIEWAIDNDMQVINMSFGVAAKLGHEVRQALKEAYQAGIVIVAAAGNEGTADGEGDTMWAPGEYKQVIAVGAIDEADNRYGSSSTGETLELVAPGVNIYSTRAGGDYANLTATSAASPHIAGVAALLIASGVSNNTKIRQILQSTAEDLGTPEWDNQYGYGLVNATGALATASSYTTASSDEEYKE